MASNLILHHLLTYPFPYSSIAQDLKTKIDEHYRINMLLDNLPVTVYDLLDAVSDWSD